MIPPEAVDAAVATSSRNLYRNEAEKAGYRQRVEAVLRAGLPFLRKQWEDQQTLEAGFGFHTYITVIDQQGEGWTYSPGHRTIDGPETLVAATPEGEPIPFTAQAVAAVVKQYQIDTGTYQPPQRSPEDVQP